MNNIKPEMHPESGSNVADNSLANGCECPMIYQGFLYWCRISDIFFRLISPLILRDVGAAVSPAAQQIHVSIRRGILSEVFTCCEIRHSRVLQEPHRIGVFLFSTQTSTCGYKMLQDATKCHSGRSSNIASVYLENGGPGFESMYFRH